MSEFRKDPVVGRWVIIATERARRPGNFVDPQKNLFTENQECPFCNNQEPPVYLVSGDGGTPWKIRVVPSGTAVLNMNEQFHRRGHGLYDVVNAYGAHEVVIETHEHIANMADLSVGQIKLVLETYVARFRELEKNENLQYVLSYKNYGWAAGSRKIGHSRSQIMGTSVNPLRVKEKLVGAKRYFDYHERCLYCDLIRQEQHAKSRIVVESDHFIVLTPFAPRFPFELLILPKEHHCDFAKGVVGKEEDLAKILKNVLSRIKIGLDDPAYNYVIQTAPFRRAGKGTRWKTIEQDYHWHIELMPRLARAAGFEKGTGFYICSIPPENTAEYLREVAVPWES
jgi:UDPglucose--hexose-1-phosphate uridylyltransferase